VYQTCLSCKRQLGSNATLESMPVGRRLAFDAAKGRLWVVCPTCRAWNLTPIDERWEAVEDCERLFRATRLRYATSEVGLAHLPSALELIRVGRPLFPELAAWRYGQRLSRLRRAWRGRSLSRLVGEPAVFHLVPDAPHALQLVPVADAPRVRLNPARDGASWSLERPLAPMDPDLPGGWTSLRAAIPLGQTFAGADGLRFGAGLFSILNRDLPVKRLLPDALAWLDRFGNPFEENAEGRGPASAFRHTEIVRDLAASVRFALEIATQESEEAVFLRGELRVLTGAWRQAEEIAAIADSLARPDWIERWLERHRPIVTHHPRRA